MTSNLASAHNQYAIETWEIDGPGVAPFVCRPGSGGTMSRGSVDGVEMCRPRRQTAGKEYHTLGALK